MTTTADCEPVWNPGEEMSECRACAVPWGRPCPTPPPAEEDT